MIPATVIHAPDAYSALPSNVSGIRSSTKLTKNMIADAKMPMRSSTNRMSVVEIAR